MANVKSKVDNRHAFYYFDRSPTNEIEEFRFEIFNSELDTRNRFYSYFIDKLYDGKVTTSYFTTICIFKRKCCISNRNQKDKHYFGVQRYTENFKVDTNPEDLEVYPCINLKVFSELSEIYQKITCKKSIIIQ